MEALEPGTEPFQISEEKWSKGISLSAQTLVDRTVLSQEEQDRLAKFVASAQKLLVLQTEVSGETQNTSNEVSWTVDDSQSGLSPEVSAACDQAGVNVGTVVTLSLIHI